MARKSKPKGSVGSSGSEFNAFMNSQDHAAWKKDYDARMKAKRYTVGSWDSKKGVRKPPIKR